MKAVFVTEHNTVSVKDFPKPKIGDGDVLVRMRACGLCGSDLEKVYGHYGMVSQRLGHEPSGEIVSLGSKVTDFKVGNRVFVHHHVPCYSCHYCQNEDYTICPQYQKSNLEPCGLAEEFLVPEWNVSRGGMIKLPDSVSFEEAAMIEPLACCIKAINKSGMKNGDDIAVVGVGPAGIMHLILSKSFGAGKVFALDINDFRLDFAKNLGAYLTINIGEQDASKMIKESTDDRGADIVIVATGSTKALLQSLELVRRGGRVILFGVPPKPSNVRLDVNRLFSNEIRLIPSLAASEKETNQALELITTKRINIKPIITHRFTLEKAEVAIKCAYEAKDVMKVLVTS
ncbi:MAG: zinc-dependent dehydrogenase [Nitrososphaerales archaeon]